MITKELNKACAEVLEVLKQVDKQMVDKIPSKFMAFLEENKDKEYSQNLDFLRGIRRVKLLPKTEAMLGFIYLKYWADEEGKQKFEQKIKQNEEFLAKELKIGLETDVFANKGNIKSQEEKIESNVLPDKISNKSFVKKIVEKIKSILKI